jgi:hypothetical protein
MHPLRLLKILFEAVAAVADVAGVHGVAPAYLCDGHAKGCGQALTVIGAGGPAALGNGHDSLDWELCPLGDFIDGNASLFQ